jgi:hypothetical protein
MPRLGLSIKDSFESYPRASKPDAYGRRPRQVAGVQIVGERDRAPIFSSLFLKVTATLAVLAMLSVALAIVRIYAFHR